MRECGLKLNFTLIFPLFTTVVTPRAGVWIETWYRGFEHNKRVVTPRAGVWIETLVRVMFSLYFEVTPRAGVWIETGIPLYG